MSWTSYFGKERATDILGKAYWRLEDDWERQVINELVETYCNGVESEKDLIPISKTLLNSLLSIIDKYVDLKSAQGEWEKAKEAMDRLDVAREEYSNNPDDLRHDKLLRKVAQLAGIYDPRKHDRRINELALYMAFLGLLREGEDKDSAKRKIRERYSLHHGENSINYYIRVGRELAVKHFSSVGGRSENDIREDFKREENKQ